MAKKKKKKYYVVWNGLNPGIYSSWSECQAQIKNYPNAKYKSFPTESAAQRAYTEGFQAQLKSKSKKGSFVPKSEIPHADIALSVDAACGGNPGKMEYQAVWVKNDQQFFYQGPFEKGTNNIGEFLALVHALALLKKKNREDIPIYTDSITAMAWVRNKKVKTKLNFDASNQILKELIERGEHWLKNNTYKNPILKWETKQWGEIPADFGRK